MDLIKFEQDFEGKLNEFSFNNKNIRILFDQENNPWFVGKDVAMILEYKDTKCAVQKHVNKNFKLSFSKLEGRKNPQIYLDPKTILINKSGLIQLIGNSTMPASIDLCEELGIKKFRRNFGKEQECLYAIMKAFSGEKMERQYRVGGHRIDLYFPYYDLAIECDENNHQNYDPKEEIARQKLIEKELCCMFIRFNPDEKNFNIFEVINQMFILIKNQILNRSSES